MSYERKKEWERRYLERVKSVYGGFPTGIVIADEEPDFLVWNGKKNWGIEIVQYVRGQGKRGSPLRWREELHDQIVARAKLKHEARSTIAFSVHLHWFHQIELRGSDVEWVSDEICKLVGEYESLEVNNNIKKRKEKEAELVEGMKHLKQEKKETRNQCLI